jgi:L-2-amino-thiazoline-4-carboxylic acid hydrolase
MNVEALPNYGKDIVTMSADSKMTFGEKLAMLGPVLSYLGGVIGELGLGGTVKMVRRVKEEIASAQDLDWSSFKAKGISEDHLQQVIRKIAMSKVMAEMMGLEKAAALRNALSNKISVKVFETMFSPASVFVEIGGGDFLPPFKQYYSAMMDAMAEKGLEVAEVVVDEADAFQLNVTWCAWAEAAKLMGNGAYCYYSTCYGDEVFFPHFCGQAGFDFARESTLALGAPACDFRFTRRQANQ